MTCPSSGALYGIHGSLRGHVQTEPQIRYTTAGDDLLEFRLKLVDDWPPEQPNSPEIVVVRFGGQQAEVARWLVFGRHLLVDGVIHLARWTGAKDGKERAQLVVEASDLHPLDEPRQNPSRAAAFAPRVSATPVPRDQQPTDAERLERMAALAEATTPSTATSKKAPWSTIAPRTAAK